jgi:hypothetical protein
MMLLQVAAGAEGRSRPEPWQGDKPPESRAISGRRLSRKGIRHWQEPRAAGAAGSGGCAIRFRHVRLQRSRDGLGSASSMSESAAGCVVRGLLRLVEGSSGLGEGRALPAAMRAATRHASFLLRQLAHFSSFGASRGHVPSFLAASESLRFIGAKRPFAPRGHLRTAQLRTQRITEMRGNGRHSCVRTFRRSGARHPSLCATQTMIADVRF